MTETAPDEVTTLYRAREAVGVFADPDALEAAVDELEIAGLVRWRGSCLCQVLIN